MDATVVAEIMEGMAVPGWERVFVLGSLDRRITIASQQVRALNLAAALVADGTCGPGDPVAVVGAGAAGLTCAAALDRLGMRVTVLERQGQVLPMFRGGSTRWLHPGVYDWPDPVWRVEESPIPLMRWSAGQVSDVLAQLEAAWSLERGQAVLKTSVTGLAIAPALEAGRRVVSWNPGGRHLSAVAVVLAVGFGLEPRGVIGEKRYWESDDLDGERVDGGEQRWLVSGCGDGALTDVLRLCIRDFRHEEIVSLFASDPRMEAVEHELMVAEKDASLSAAALHAVYAAVDAPWVRQALGARRREATVLTLNAPVNVFLDRSASPLNRFLVGQLHQIGAFDVLGGRIGEPKHVGDAFQVSFADGSHPPRAFDRVVRRHGPVPAVSADFPAISAALDVMRQARAQAPVSLDRTRRPLWDEGAFGPEAAPPPPLRRATEAGFRAVVVGADDVADWSGVVEQALTRSRGAVEVIRTGSLADRVGKARAADVLVVILGHRLGLVEGDGDEQKSATGGAIAAAAEAGIPVVAAVIDEHAPWTQPREEADLGREGVDIDALLWRVSTLRELKRNARDAIRFGVAGAAERPSDLAAAISQRVAEALTATSAPSRPRRRWVPRFEHPLQPAPQFSGRQTLLARLREWWLDPASADRVIGLVAIGGAGKTAIAERLTKHMLENPVGGGLFVWSFYENDRIDDFLVAACTYFVGHDAASAGARLWALKGALRTGEAHLMVLDGLERVQEDASPGRARGHLPNTSLRQLLQSLAAGLGRARALVTSRFELADLNSWSGAGYRPEVVDDLDPAAARAVLRGWRVEGEDGTLDELANRVGRHALSVSVLGSYIQSVGGGSPEVVNEVDLRSAGELDDQANRLARLIAAYAAQLSDAERQVMARLSVLREGIGLDVLADLVADGAVAGILVHRDQAELAFYLSSLAHRGLVFRYRTSAGVVFTAHPFVRDAFAALLDVPEEGIHAAMVERLESRLDERPGQLPSDEETLARYESLLAHMIQAGRANEAVKVFQDRVGGYGHLRELGHYESCARLARLFLDQGSVLSVADMGWLRTDLGLSMESLGDLVGGEAYHRLAEVSARGTDSHGTTFVNLSHVVRAQGRLHEAVELARAGQRAFDEVGDRDWALLGQHMVGVSLLLSGETSEALELVQEATEDHLFVLAECTWLQILVRLGRWTEAREAGDVLLGLCREDGSGRVEARLHNVLGTITSHDRAVSGAHLQAARAWAAKTGDLEVMLDSHRLAAQMATEQGDLTAAAAELADAVLLADANGWGLHSIDLRLDRAQLHLDRRDHKSAQREASEAIERASEPACGYRWGTACGLHILGRVLAERGEADRAIRQLREAVEMRRAIDDPNLVASELLLGQLGG